MMAAAGQQAYTVYLLEGVFLATPARRGRSGRWRRSSRLSTGPPRSRLRGWQSSSACWQT